MLSFTNCTMVKLNLSEARKNTSREDITGVSEIKKKKNKNKQTNKLSKGFCTEIGI